MTIKKAIEVLKTYNHEHDKEGGQAFKVAIKSLENKLKLDLIEFYPYNLAMKIYGGKEFRNHEEHDGNTLEEKALSLSIQGIEIGISTLSEREQEVIYYRLKDGLTLKQTGVELGVTQERIRQIEAKAIRKLRHPSRIAKMKAYTYEDMTKDRDRLNELQEKNKLLEKAIRTYTKKEIDKEQLEIIAGKADLYNIPIEDLDLSVRSYNIVKRKGIKSIGELAEVNYEELLQFRNAGRKTVDEIIRNLKEFNVYLKGVKYD